MKKLTFMVIAAFLAVFGGSLASAQGKYGADSAECIKYLSYYQDYFKQKNYESAIPNWRKAYSICPPTANQNMLLNGATFMRQLIAQNADNPEYKAALIDTLLSIHGVRAQYYPKYQATAMNNMGQDAITYLEDSQALYDCLKLVSMANGAETSPNILVVLMNSIVDLYQNGKASEVQVFAEYQFASDLLDQIRRSSEEDDFSKYENGIQNLLITSGIADCDKLVELFTPRFEAEPDSYDLAASIVKIMSITEGGTGTDLFKDAAATMHRLQPSSSSAYFMFRVYSTRGEYDNAEKMINQAIEYEDVDDDLRARYYFELAALMIMGNRTSKAFEYASKAAAADRHNEYAGKAYMICGTVWGAVVCPGNEIEQRAPYWVAVDYYNRAKSADPSLTEDCNRQIAQYSKFYPTAEDAFMYDIEAGQTYTVSCGGMTATTTVKTQK